MKTRWTREDVQRVLYEVIVTYEQAKTLGGDSELLRNRINIARQTLIDNGWWASPETAETRVVNPTTGGEKGQKLARYDLIPPRPLEQLAEHYGRGARKYADRNWERGYDWSLSYRALIGHAVAFWGGEDIDPETGSPHLAAVAWHAFTLLEFAATHPELDDRPVK